MSLPVLRICVRRDVATDEVRLATLDPVPVFGDCSDNWSPSGLVWELVLIWAGL